MCLYVGTVLVWFVDVRFKRSIINKHQKCISVVLAMVKTNSLSSYASVGSEELVDFIYL